MRDRDFNDARAVVEGIFGKHRDPMSSRPGMEIFNLNQVKDDLATELVKAGCQTVPVQVIKTSTWRATYPTAKHLTLEIMPLVVERSKLPFWRFVRRAKLTAEIESLVITGRMLGYFNVNKH